MTVQYENQGGLLVKPGTDQCDAHNAILAKAERDSMIAQGRGTFYLHRTPWTINARGERIRENVHDYVTQWTGEWKGRAYTQEGHSYGFCYVKTYWVWFTGPDGKKWYGVNKGDMDCFTGRRLKNQK